MKYYIFADKSMDDVDRSVKYNLFTEYQHEKLIVTIIVLRSVSETAGDPITLWILYFSFTLPPFLTVGIRFSLLFLWSWSCPWATVIFYHDRLRQSVWSLENYIIKTALQQRYGIKLTLINPSKLILLFIS